ncbi:MAG TPA: STT3 domain-containing protein, partial [Candidatus Thermoplasmatota archaeon]|nr:STT3 domain-containing protein [Candidatus Thermoplasmatota archaeon]
MAEGSPHSRRSTWIWLGIFVLLAFGLRFAFSIGSGFDEGTGRYLFTGNDPYYHYHTLEQILDTGKHVTFDPAINYPGGNYNPNPPIYVWSAAPLAAALQAGGASDPIGLALNIMVAVWGALTVIPVYLLGRDLWSRRAGLWAAFLLAVSAPHIERTIAGYADHDAPTMFFITLAFAFMVKALLGIQQRTYVARWSQAAGRSAGLKAAWTENRRPILWSAMAGLALTATALTWKGYPYALAIMAIAAGLQLIIEHLRRRDATPVFLVYLVPMVLVTFLPWLLYYRSFPTFQDTTVVPSMYVLLGVVVAGLLFVPTRNLPSVLVIPAAALLAIIGALVLKFLVPDVWGAITTGLGYFRTSKLYSTIAEAQRPEIGSVAGRFGFFTFLLVFWGIGLTVRGAFRGQPAMTLVLVWALVALFMAFRASRFIMNAAPVFVLLIGATIVTVLGYAGWDELARRLRNRRGQGAGAYAGALTWRSVLGTLAVLLLLVLPTVWAGFDAATTRDFERENGLDNRWFGAFGIGYE